jgi:hypothetical protein
MSQDVRFFSHAVPRPASVITVPDSPVALIDPNDVVMRVCRRLAKTVPETVRMSTFLSRGVGPVEADAVKFEQIILNAIIASPVMTSRQGKLRISTFSTAEDLPHNRNFEVIEKMDGLKNACSIEVHLRSVASS